MMALRDSALYSSWALHFMTTFTIIAAAIVAVGGKLFQFSDKAIIFIYYFLCASVSYSFVNMSIHTPSKNSP